MRADSGFFEEALLAFLEERHLPYLVVARLTTRLKRRAAGWAMAGVDEHYAAGEFRRTAVWLVGRAAVHRGAGADAGRTRRRWAANSLTCRATPFGVWVTNRSEPVLELWRDYNGRACVEQRIEELKNDLAADDFCPQNFWRPSRRSWPCCSPSTC